MSSFQRYVAVGNLGGDPEIKIVGDKTVAKFRLAIGEPWRNKTQWLSCEYWRGGRVLEFLQKGSQILVEGKLDNQEWEKDGQKRSQVVVNVDNITLLGGHSGHHDEDQAVRGERGSGQSPTALDEFGF